MKLNKNKNTININNLEEEIEKHNTLRITCFSGAESKMLLRKLHNLGYQWRSGTSLINYKPQAISGDYSKKIIYRIANNSVSYSMSGLPKHHLGYIY